MKKLLQYPKKSITGFIVFDAERVHLFECVVTFCVVLLFSPSTNGESIIKVPIRFHIITELNMQKNGLVMDSWVNHEMIKQIVLPEVNRIWRRSGILFKLESVVQSRALYLPNRAELIKYIVNSHRNDYGKSDPRRIKKLYKLIGRENYNSDVINVYFVPYLGEKSQGNAKPKQKRILIGQWTDKASKAKVFPKKFQLTESLPFRRGSLSRTVAHEIGHVLGLNHPDKASQTTFNLLMGGRKAGYDLTSQEIKTARRKAIELFVN